MKKILYTAFLSFVVAETGFGSGFALYQSSAVATAMGGALLGEAADGSANSVNPATLSDITNYTATIGMVTEHPRARIKINGHTHQPMDPGAFVLPHFHLVVPLPWDFTFGLGGEAAYGLGTHYVHDNPMNWSSRETTIEGYVVNPNLSYRVTDRWSVAAGARILSFDFEQYSYPYGYNVGPYQGVLKNHLHGDNDFEDVGWQVGTRYRLLDNLSLGLVYKSKIDVSVKGDSTTSVVSDPLGFLAGVAGTGSASADLELPQSVAVGCNWDISDTWHLGGVVSWTEWSSIDTIVFNLPTGKNPVELNWEDTWRVGIAPSWDFYEDWTAIVSYVYDMNACPSDQKSTMLPPGDRQIITGGLVWRATKNLELAMSYGLVIMGSGSMHLQEPRSGQNYRLECHRGLSHAVGASVTLRF